MESKARKIIIVGTAYPLRGGLAAFNERLARQFQLEGDEVIIYTFSLQYPSFLFPGKTQYSSDPAPKDLTIREVLNSVNPFSWWKVGRMIKREKPDIVISKFWLPFMGPSLGTVLRLSKSKNTKRISILDNIIPHEKRVGDKLLAQYFVNSTDAFIAMSRSVAKDMEQFTTTKPVVYIPHPIYDNFGEIVSRTEGLAFLGLEKQVNYILFFGFIRDYKGLDLLLEAMADERIRRMNLKLIVAGEYYSNEEKYLALIEKLKIADQLELRTDFIPNSEVRYYFAAADAVVQPYKSATQSGISQMAYHFEKPMVVTKVGGLPEIVEHGVAGYVVDVDPQAIADALVDFYDGQKVEQLSAGVKVAKKRFAWSTMTQAVKDF